MTPLALWSQSVVLQRGDCKHCILAGNSYWQIRLMSLVGQAVLPSRWLQLQVSRHHCMQHVEGTMQRVQ